MFSTVLGSVRADDPEAQSPARDEGSALVHTMSFTLVDGQIDVGRLLGGVGDSMGLDGQAIAGSVDFKVDADGVVGTTILEQLRQWTRDVVSYDRSDTTLTVRLDRVKLRREEKGLRSQFRGLIETWFPEAAAHARTRYGLWVYADTNADPDRLADAALDGPVVVLVHGLDDPGRVWITLRPALIDAGYTVMQFEYPNDQAIEDSTRLFADELKQLKTLGVDQVQIVSHSMGGLVCRDVLTDAEWYAGRGHGHDDYPDIVRLIMVGTPHHGSQWARLRITAEVRDQVTRVFNGDWHFFDGVFDGAGEAKLDLLPNSEFLAALNARPLPEGVRLTIIAGRASPWSDDQIAGSHQQLESALGQQPKTLHEAKEVVQWVVKNAGDGVVTLESSVLEGVDDYTVVEGTHLSIIRNLLESSDRVPPALPVIIDRLGQDASKPSS